MFYRHKSYSSIALTCVCVCVRFRKRSEKSTPCGSGHEGLQKDRQLLFLQLEEEEAVTQGTERVEPAPTQAQNVMPHQMGINATDDRKAS